MLCPNCNSSNIKVEMVTETTIRRKRKGVIWWVYFITIGWIVEVFLWLFLTLPRLIFALFKPKKYKVNTKSKKIAICQNCGHSWKIK